MVVAFFIYHSKSLYSDIKVLRQICCQQIFNNNPRNKPRREKHIKNPWQIERELLWGMRYEGTSVIRREFYQLAARCEPALGCGTAGLPYSKSDVGGKYHLAHKLGRAWKEKLTHVWSYYYYYGFTWMEPWHLHLQQVEPSLLQGCRGLPSPQHCPSSQGWPCFGTEELGGSGPWISPHLVLLPFHTLSPCVLFLTVYLPYLLSFWNSWPDLIYFCSPSQPLASCLEQSRGSLCHEMSLPQVRTRGNYSDSSFPPSTVQAYFRIPIGW